jgi:hypothetical protein
MSGNRREPSTSVSTVKPARAACAAIRPWRAALPAKSHRAVVAAWCWPTAGAAMFSAKASACAVCRSSSRISRAATAAVAKPAAK